jgi:hypothetical protein
LHLMIKMCFIPRYYARAAGSFVIAVTAMDTVDHCLAILGWEKYLRKKYDDNGMLFNNGTNTMWGSVFEGSHFAVCEGGHLFNPTREEAFRSDSGLIEEAMRKKLETPTALAWNPVTEPVVKMVGPHISNYHNWMSKINKVYDPNGTSDPSGYISAEKN